jgi:hypothetical protein
MNARHCARGLKAAILARIFPNSGEFVRGNPQLQNPMFFVNKHRGTVGEEGLAKDHLLRG